MSVMALFLIIDLAFFGANALKMLQGGWVTLAVALALFTLMTTWKTGRRLVAERLTARAIPLDDFMATVDGRAARAGAGDRRLHDRAADRHAAGARAQPPLQQGAARTRRSCSR